MTTGLVLQHGEDCPPGLLAEWAQQRGIELALHRMDLAPAPALDEYGFVATLGSAHAPDDVHLPEVAAERELVGEAVARDVPVLGLCYGGQMLARVLGGRIEPADPPELGWHTVRSSAPELIDEGPWLQWHYHRFTLPDGARALADSPTGVQAFIHGRHLGVQFHPESTIEIVCQWARLDAERLAGLGVADGEALVRRGAAHAAATARKAHDLFDAFLHLARP